MSLKSLEELLTLELLQLLDAEDQLNKALTQWRQAATTESLKELFQVQKQESKKQIDRLKKSFGLLNVNEEKKSCKAIEGLIFDSKEITDIKEQSIVKDTALIAFMQKIVHYTIASYNAAKSYANLLYSEQVVALLTTSLKEKNRFSRKLTKIAEGTFFKEGIINKAVLFDVEE